MCDQRELDVFLTAHHDVDEVLVETSNDGILSMQSVRYEPSTISPLEHEITIVDRATTWLAPTKLCPTDSHANLLKVGDRIRLGDTRHWGGVAGHLDYVTILEVKGPINKVYNGVGASIDIGWPSSNPITSPTPPGLLQSGSKNLLNFDPGQGDDHSSLDLQANGRTWQSVYCYRVSAPVNATALPNSVKAYPISAGQRDSSNTITYANRLDTYANGNATTPGGASFLLWADQHGAVPYPVYRTSFQGVGKAAGQTHLVLKLDAGVKHVHEIRLLGYQLTSKDAPIAGTYVGPGEANLAVVACTEWPISVPLILSYLGRTVRICSILISSRVRFLRPRIFSCSPCTKSSSLSSTLVIISDQAA